MTKGTGEGAAGTGADSFARDWEQLRSQADIQFAPVKDPPPAETPEWLRRFFEWWSDLLSPLGEVLSRLFAAAGRFLGVSGQFIMWAMIALAGTIILYILWRVAVPLVEQRRRGGKIAASAEWAPDTEDAVALLEDADRLAAEGRFDEATHLLLKRSIGHITEARPGLLDPSSTAREIAELPALSQRAQGAFRVIAGQVERSLFALRGLTAADWQTARSAYAEFALAAPAPAQGRT